MVKKFKLKRKIFFENLNKSFKKKNDQKFQTRCNFSHKEVTERIHLKCLICKNFDFGLESVFSNLKFDFHFPDHLSLLKAPNYIPVFYLDWNFGEELRLSNSLQQFGNLDWKKISNYIGTRTLPECESHYFNLQLRRKNYYISLLNRLPRAYRKNLIVENQSHLLKIWNIILENKFNWIPQRGENFFEWENNLEEKIETKKIPPKSWLIGYSFPKKVLTHLNRNLYEREIAKEFFCRAEIFPENILSEPDFNTSFRKSIVRNEYIYLLNQNILLDEDNEDLEKKKKKKKIFKNWINFLTLEETEVCQKTLQNFRKVHFFKSLKKGKFFFSEIKNQKKIKIELDSFLLSPKEKNICKHIGLFSFQFFFFRTVVFSKKTKIKGISKFFFGLNSNILILLSEIMSSFYGLDILRNKIKRLKNS